MNIVFFGSHHTSVIVLEKLHQVGHTIVSVVTKPPRPAGRKKVLTETPVSNWAKKKQISLITPTSQTGKPWLFADEAKLTQAVLTLKPDILISANYTIKIPMTLISQVNLGGLNIHPSLLPAYRGPAPVAWTILNGDIETGVSIVTLTDQFDQGEIITQQKEPILPTDTTPILTERLFFKGANLLINLLPNYPNQPKNLQPTTNNLQPSYYPRLTRDHGFEPWENIKKAITNGQDAARIDRKFRALHPWPGLWTKVKKNGKQTRMKILFCRLHPTTYSQQPTTNNLQLISIQFEGKKPTSNPKSISNLFI